MSIVELYAPVGRHFSRLEQEDRQHYEKWLLAQGVNQVAKEIAAERGLSGMAAEYFVDGFNGRSAAFVNPRKDGMEPVFRDGRRAKAEKGMAQRCRAAAAALRAKEGYAMDDWLEIAYPCSPVPWRSAFGG